MSWKAIAFTTSTVVLTTLAASYATPVRALTLNYSDATWGEVDGGENVNTYTSGGEKQVHWGTPVNLDLGQSGLGFTGVGETEIEPNIVFELGQLRHFNNPILGGTAASAADLSIDLSFAEIGLQKFDFTLEIDETTNSGICEYPSEPGNPCADAISWNNAFSSHEFSYQGGEYNLQLIGFSNSPGGSIKNQFISQEGGTSSAHLFATINQLSEPEPVPEPATGIGLAVLGMYFVRSFRKHAANNKDEEL